MKKNYTLFQKWPIWCHTVTCSTNFCLKNNQNFPLTDSILTEMIIYKVLEFLHFMFQSGNYFLSILHLLKKWKSFLIVFLSRASSALLPGFRWKFHPENFYWLSTKISIQQSYNWKTSIAILSFFVCSYDSIFLVSHTVLPDYRNIQQI